MKTIPLTKCYFTKVDDEDYEKFAIYRWYALDTNNAIRATRVIYISGKAKRLWLSREILGITGNKWVDHINGDTLDNRKNNLRICTPSENAMNKKKPKTNTSGYKGVRKSNRKNNPWRAQIKVNNKSIHLGNYKTKKEAYEAYKKSAKKYFKEFANF